ncbi:MAG: hypothetical protein KAJ75_00380, partial [Alphaproteobacteria bacterium]|nr:hypothetical protein [Alphaproteobacteria bacterium]
HLGKQRLSLLPDNTLKDVFQKAPDRLKESLLKRLKWFDTSPEAQAFAEHLLADENINTKDIDRLVHVVPDIAMEAIQRVFGNLTNEELKENNSERRYLVWALEKLVFRKESFDRAATLLRKLATEQFKKLYQLYLSGTEASPDMRLLVLDDGLKSENQKEREVCVEALNYMLKTQQFSRSGGAEEIGSDEPLKDWCPNTYGETRDFYREAIKRLTKIATTENDALASNAKETLGRHIRGLIGSLPFEEIKSMISDIVSHYGFWHEAIKGINEWLYFDSGKKSNETRKVIRDYYDELMPSNPVELVVLYTQGYVADFRNPDIDFSQEEETQSDYEWAIRQAANLANVIAQKPDDVDDVIDRLVVGNATSVFAFSQRLSEISCNPIDLFKQVLAKVEKHDEPANYEFFRGLISGADKQSKKIAHDCVRLALQSEKLKSDAISMIGAVKLQPSDIQLVVSLLQSKDVSIWQCATLSYGRRMDHLKIEDITPILEELMLNETEGLWVALEIISILIHGGKKLENPLVEIIKNILINPSLFDKTASNPNGYHLQEMVALLAKHNLIDKNFALNLIQQLLSVCEKDFSFFYSLKQYVRSVFKLLIQLYPKEVWSNISKRLIENEFNFKNLIEFEDDDSLGAGLLYTLPNNLYLEWVREDAQNRAHIVMEWLPIANKAKDGSLSWHPALESFITEFGSQEYVLESLSGRLQVRSWSGSIVPYLKSRIPLLETWKLHKQENVRQ